MDLIPITTILQASVPAAREVAKFVMRTRRLLDAYRQVLDDFVGSEDKIGEQSLEELNESLAAVERAIEDPNIIDGSERIRRALEPGGPNQEARIQKIVLPALLERKSLILRRINVLSSQQQVSEIRDVIVDSLAGHGATDELLKSIEAISDRAAEHSRDLELQAERADQQRERYMRLEVELKERRSAIYRSWIERESIASIVGAILLLGLGIAIVVAMFVGTTVTEVVTGSFLVILGYFFGQTTNKRSEPTANE
jgi:hypothetical protein